MFLKPIIVEAIYSNDSKRYLEFDIVPDLLVSGTGNTFPGVTCDDPDDEDGQTIAYGVNEGRVIRADCRPNWADINDDPNEVDFVAWRVIDGVELLIDHGIVDAPIDLPPPRGFV